MRFVGLVTLANPPGFVGLVTLADSPGFVGLVTLANPPGLIDLGRVCDKCLGPNGQGTGKVDSIGMTHLERSLSAKSRERS
ncbi:hypothetical protein BDW75DRAFT_197553 [Aspergillus navahoensis]